MSDDALHRLEAALGDRYAIERELGRGGMAAVYLAADLKHDRQVAVKVLHSPLAAAIGSERFLREIKITAQLSHPHILPLLDSGEAGGLLYYVMPYVGGGSLRRRLAPGEPLPIEVVVRIARQVADALDFAHRHGVIHRDVKPENILFSDSHAIVADFGIAKAVSSVGREALTGTGAPLGTVGYMSPEQAMGAADLDERTDVYSLACVVYEMLVGATPSVWPMQEDVRLGRLSDAPPDHRRRLDALPGRVEQTLTRALAVGPAHRFAAPGELADALDVAAAGSGRALTESEVREVIGRAAELQAEHPTEQGALSIGAVEQVAAEVGIPPERVRQAVKELEGRSDHASPAKRLPGRGLYPNSKLRVERTIAGEVPESAHQALVKEIQAEFDVVGHASALGKSLTWSPVGAGQVGRKLLVTVAPEGDRTRICIEEQQELRGLKIVPLGLGILFSALLGFSMLQSLGVPGDMNILIVPFILGGGWATANLIFLNGAQDRYPQLERLADRLAAIAETAARPRLRPGAEESR